MLSHPCVSNSKVLFASIGCNTNGNNTIVAAAGAGKKIRVLSFHLTLTGTAITVAFQDGAGGTALTGTMGMAQNATIDSGFCPVGHFETSANTLLNLSLSAGQAVAGWIVYQTIGGTGSGVS